MKSIMTSVSPYLCEKTASGQCKILVRKSAPKEVPFKAFIYCTKSDKYLLDRDSDGSMFCWDKKEHHYPFKYEKDHEELFNGKVIGEFICDKIEDFYCASVPYQKENNLWYGRFVDNGVYKVDGWHEGIVFERNDRFIDSMLNNNDLKKMCLSAQELFDYIGIGKHLYGWHISNLRIYDKPKELSEFKPCCKHNGECDNCKYFGFQQVKKGNVELLCPIDIPLTRPPQSYMFVEEI